MQKRPPSARAAPMPPLLPRLQFLVIGSNFLLKAVVLNCAYAIYLLTADFGTDLFSDDVGGFTFLYCTAIVNLMAFLFYRGLASRANRPSAPDRIDRSLNLAVVAIVMLVFITSFVGLGQKILSLSASTALLAIAANSRALALLSLIIFVAGVPQAIALDEFIPMIFCAVLNVFVFLPWLATKGRSLLFVLAGIGAALVAALSVYYVNVRYSPFKLIERIFEQAAPLSWKGDPLLWFHPYAAVGGMPDERVTMVMDGTWDAQFKVTYLITNAPVLGSAFLLMFAYALGRFTGRTLLDCRVRGTSVLNNFLKLKLILVLIEVMGEKVSDPGKILAYVVLIAAIAALESAWARGQHQVARVAA